MQAKDVMTSDPVTVSPETPVSDIARLLLHYRISAVPVADSRQRVIGVVSEGDLVQRAETGTEPRRSWWLWLIADPEQRARDYVKSHGRHASDVMSYSAVTVTEDTPLKDIAVLLEHRRIKRVPVVREGKLVGIVSRADLVRALASCENGGTDVSSTPDDQRIRRTLLQTFSSEGLETAGHVNVIVTDGIVHLWGIAESEDNRRALRVAAENVPGVRGVEDHLGRVAPWAWAS